ncbi:bifunctional diguanylate cyclase/phosphodiesterase [Lacticaseibacillus hulanensis]|uniref:bifunctional diguanylate cyclase/phosphodiesterase n=1 Tax=Lacticaseibacillus hulanensis TaxID=2493111 RepID=UPI000FDC08FC|nr:diguanylate cyclase [Lacticaseibacillus hulanensis]
MTLGSWFGRFILSVFFVAGYTTYFSSRFYQQLVEGGDDRPRLLNNRLILLLIPLVVTLGLQLAAATAPSDQGLYLNLQLFITSYTLLDENQEEWEYALNWFIFAMFWMLNHPFDAHLFLLVAVVFTALYFVIRRWQYTIHYHRLANTIFAIAVSVLYWSTYVGLGRDEAILNPIIFFIMSGYAFFYWLSIHRREEERERMLRELNEDTLTGARSLKMFLTISEEQFHEAVQQNEPLAVAVIDIDRFKMFNDDYGHAAGDAVLIGITKIIQRVLEADGGRAGLYRTGGEEMTIVMPGYTLVDASRLIHLCWANVRSERIIFEGNRFRCTISAGVTEREDDDMSLLAMTKRADGSLYMSKQRGRDCVTVNGIGDARSGRESTMMNYTFFTQPIVRISDNSIVSNEMLLRVYDHGKWTLPHNFDVTVPTIINLMQRAVNNLEVPSLCMNFELRELVDPEIKDALINYMNDQGGKCAIVVELDHMDDYASFRQVAPDYLAAGIKFTIDSVGIEGTYAQFAPVLDLFTYAKMPLNELRRLHDEDKIRELIRYWESVAKTHNLTFILQGIETDRDIHLANDFAVTMGQGYYFSRPVLPRIL